MPISFTNSKAHKNLSSHVEQYSIQLSYLFSFRVYPNWPDKMKKAKRRLFLRQLALALAQPFMEQRKRGPRSESSARVLSNIYSTSTAGCSSEPPIAGSSSEISTAGSSSEPPIKRARESIVPQPKRGRCTYCVQEKSSKAKYNHELSCCICGKIVCKAHHNRNVCTVCIINI